MDLMSYHLSSESSEGASLFTKRALPGWARYERAGLRAAPLVVTSTVDPRPEISKPVTAKAINQTLNSAASSLVARQLQNLPQASTATAGPSAGPCPGGCTPQTPSRYSDRNPRCDTTMKDKILERQSADPLFASLLNPTAEIKQYLNPNCVAMYMELLPPSHFTQSCSGSPAMPRPIARSCIEDNYVKLVTNSFNVASTCLSSWVSPEAIQLAGKLFPHESGFHINAKSGINGTGVGQLVNIAIDDVNQNALGNIRTALNRAGAPEQCGRISSEMFQQARPLESGMGNECDRMSVEKRNPLLNMMYSMSLIQIMHNRMESTWRAHASSMNLSPADFKQVKEQVMTWAYNLGGGITARLVSQVLQRHRSSPATNPKALVEKIKTEVQGEIASNIIRSGGSSERGYREGQAKGAYPSVVHKKFNDVNTHFGGGQCLRTQ